MQMPGRKYSATTATTYRFGFNGQEKDVELNENITTAEFWEYDSRIGRRWNTDPKQKVEESPYLTFGDSPILLNDPSGDYPPGPGDGIIFGFKIQISYKTHKLILTDAFIKTQYAMGNFSVVGGATLNNGGYLGVSYNNPISYSKTISGKELKIEAESPTVAIGFERLNVTKGFSSSIGTSVIFLGKKPQMNLFNIPTPTNPISPTNIPVSNFPSDVGTSANATYMGQNIAIPSIKLFKLGIVTRINQDLELPPPPMPDKLSDIKVIGNSLSAVKNAIGNLNLPTLKLGKKIDLEAEAKKQVDKIGEKKIQELIKGIFDKIKAAATK
jgi:hypothetical protein